MLKRQIYNWTDIYKKPSRLKYANSIDIFDEFYQRASEDPETYYFYLRSLKKNNPLYYGALLLSASTNITPVSAFYGKFKDRIEIDMPKSEKGSDNDITKQLRNLLIDIENGYLSDKQIKMRILSASDFLSRDDYLVMKHIWFQDIDIQSHVLKYQEILSKNDWIWNDICNDLLYFVNQRFKDLQSNQPKDIFIDGKTEILPISGLRMIVQYPSFYYQINPETSQRENLVVHELHKYRFEGAGLTDETNNRLAIFSISEAEPTWKLKCHFEPKKITQMEFVEKCFSDAYLDASDLCLVKEDLGSHVITHIDKKIVREVKLDNLDVLPNPFSNSNVIMVTYKAHGETHSAFIHKDNPLLHEKGKMTAKIWKPFKIVELIV